MLIYYWLTLTGLILSSTLDVIGYISRSLAQRYRAKPVIAKFTDRVAARVNGFIAAFTPQFAPAVA